MINAVHPLLYAADADKARAFFRDVLGWPYVDAHGGWLIFALPPAELGVHPTDGAPPSGAVELYLMCDDVKKTIADLKKKGVKVLTPVVDRGYGLCTSIEVPGAGEVGLYQPKHAVACKPLAAPAKAAKPAGPKAKKAKGKKASKKG